MSSENGKNEGQMDGVSQPANGAQGPGQPPTQDVPGEALAPLEGLRRGFMCLCDQYEQMGQQLKWMAYALKMLGIEEAVREAPKVMIARTLPPERRPKRG